MPPPADTPVADTPPAERWTVVTGASSGIGAEMARLFAAKGRPLVLTARRAERLDALKAEIQAAHGVRVETIVADLARPEAPDALAAEIERRGIVVDTLVNNAGFGLRGRVATLPYDEQVEMLQLNVVALTRLSRVMVPGMIARRRGGIINVGSTASFQAVPYLGIYAATKAYVLSFTEALHQELKGTGVVATALCPGATATEFGRRADMEMMKMFKHAMSAVEVARLGIDAYERGDAIVVTGAANRLGTLVVRLVPRSLVRWGAARLQK